MGKYSVLKTELANMLSLPESIKKVIPVVIGVLGSNPILLKSFWDQLNVQ